MGAPHVYLVTADRPCLSHIAHRWCQTSMGHLTCCSNTSHAHMPSWYWNPGHAPTMPQAADVRPAWATIHVAPTPTMSMSEPHQAAHAWTPANTGHTWWQHHVRCFSDMGAPHVYLVTADRPCLSHVAHRWCQTSMGHLTCCSNTSHAHMPSWSWKPGHAPTMPQAADVRPAWATIHVAPTPTMSMSEPHQAAHAWTPANTGHTWWQHHVSRMSCKAQHGPDVVMEIMHCILMSVSRRGWAMP